MRIDDDGSHSIDRVKVFIYDIALLINEYTAKRHPGFLIHDNILDVDQDTLMKSIKFINEKVYWGSSQYIITINSDRFGTDKEFINLEPYIRASFTKQNRFLRKKYQQTH